ncbi:hypothetical protein OUZ56_012786 [Daphnia magna]|uniref:Regulatory protein zeste n=1 Tax=Daphnia magna TaxID=35525 RepID=A0ABQ9Z424_9CRUS|nr:hypothetical protein OUZ56_012786 [Daphnia magna]
MELKGKNEKKRGLQKKLIYLWISLSFDTINGMLSATITKDTKKAAWSSIEAILNVECPDGEKKDVGPIKKKWNNLIRETRAELAKYNSSIRGTGGGGHPG